MRRMTRLLPALLLVAAAQAALGAPLPGQHYIVDERCITVTEVRDGQVHYEWREGNTSGGGNLPAAWLGAACTATAAGNASSQSPARSNPPTASAPAARPMQPRTSQAAPPTAPAQRATQAPAAARATAPTNGFARDILAAHNRLRCLHGAPPLQWRNDVAAYAQRWAAKLARESDLNHSDSFHSPLGPMGENLARGYASGAAAAQAWYDESDGYDYGRVEQDGMTGHFTAMIWQGVRYVGCAQVGDVVVCNYSAGNTAADCANPNFNMDSCALQAVRPVSQGAQACR